MAESFSSCRGSRLSRSPSHVPTISACTNQTTKYYTCVFVSKSQKPTGNSDAKRESCQESEGDTNPGLKHLLE